MKMRYVGIVCLLSLIPLSAWGLSEVFKANVFDPGQLRSIDSELKVAVGDKAPDFTLFSVSGQKVILSAFQGKKNVVISFVPAAWTPVCSDQWPGYNIAREIFEQHNATLLGITVDNIPTLFAWTRQMGGLWFDVLSDFWPHGQVAGQYGVLRTDGVTERAIFIIDTQGVIRFIHVGDINRRPDLGMIVQELERLNSPGSK